MRLFKWIPWLVLAARGLEGKGGGHGEERRRSRDEDGGDSSHVGQRKQPRNERGGMHEHLTPPLAGARCGGRTVVGRARRFCCATSGRTCCSSRLEQQVAGRAQIREALSGATLIGVGPHGPESKGTLDLGRIRIG